jgi:hypothetical protein
MGAMLTGDIPFCGYIGASEHEISHPRISERAAPKLASYRLLVIQSLCAMDDRALRAALTPGA